MPRIVCYFITLLELFWKTGIKKKKKFFKTLIRTD